MFNIGLLGKDVDGVLELIGGALLVWVEPSRIDAAVRMMTLHELSEDPHDVIAGLLGHVMKQVSVETQAFAAFFLLLHGFVKVGLVAALVREKLWAYPAAIGAFTLFLAYQAYRYAHTRSVWLIVLSVLDLGVIVITWLEYARVRRSSIPNHTASP